jgi:putative ABC transport system permease protein
MTWVALKMLTGDKTKYFGIIFGVAFAAMLMTQQMAMFWGLMTRTISQIVDVKGVDLWVMDRDVLQIDDYKPMSDTALNRVRSVPGVRWAVPFFKNVARVRLTTDPLEASREREKESGGLDATTIYQQAMLIGLDDATLVGAPAPKNVLLGKLEDLRRPNAVMIDQYGCTLLWHAEKGDLKTDDDYRRFMGRTIEMNDNLAVVVAICKVTPNFASLPIIYTTYERAKRFVPPERKILPYILVKLDDNASAGKVSEQIAAETANLLKARTPEQFEADTMWYYFTRTGIPVNFGMTVALGFIVGTAIAGQTFYQFTVENLKQFGALKAMGVSNRRILGMILLQALVVGPVGYGLGVGVAAQFGNATRNNPVVAFDLPWQILALSAIAVLIICLLSSLLSIRRVLVLEPAIVFRG